MAITSIQKVIQIGSSEGVTLPAKDLDALGVKKGDELKVTFEPANAPTEENLETLKDYQKFKKQYASALKNLAQR